MDFPADQVAELKRLWPGAQRAEEGGITFILLPGLAMPEGCSPASTDVLFCPTPRDGYPSRLYFADVIQSPKVLNWAGQSHILGRTWQAFSWRVDEPGLRLAQLVMTHLQALR